MPRKKGKPKKEVKADIANKLSKKFKERNKETDLIVYQDEELELVENSNYETSLLTSTIHELILTKHSVTEILRTCEKMGTPVKRWKVYDIKKKLKNSLQERFSKDFNEDYMFVKDNYMRLFKDAYDNGDAKLQTLILKEFKALAGLDVQKIEVKNLEITTEMLEAYDNDTF